MSLKIGKRATCLMMCLLLAVCITGCSNKDNEKSKNTEITGSTDNTPKDEIIEWNYDLTGDGTDEKILVNISSTNPNDERYIDPDEPGHAIVPNTIEIYSGKTKDMIWSKSISGAHMDQDSINLYEKDGKHYLLEWNPGMWQGDAV